MAIICKQILHAKPDVINITIKIHGIIVVTLVMRIVVIAQVLMHPLALIAETDLIFSKMPLGDIA